MFNNIELDLYANFVDHEQNVKKKGHPEKEKLVASKRQSLMS
jgi:hypothetical protein